jgi:high affinity Mn2+ porin
LRAGVFDLSATPAGGFSPNGGVLDPTFQQYALVAEIEKRYDLWGQPGKIKVTSFLNRGRAGRFQDAITLAQVTGEPADITAVRRYTSRPGIHMNLEQQVSDTVGVFARAGWSDGKIEPWDFTDIDRTVSGGVSINGRNWGRPDDTIGIAGVANNISGVHRAYLNAGGLGILIGDGQLPNPGLEKIFEKGETDPEHAGGLRRGAATWSTDGQLVGKGFAQLTEEELCRWNHRLRSAATVSAARFQ